MIANELKKDTIDQFGKLVHEITDLCKDSESIKSKLIGLTLTQGRLLRYIEEKKTLKMSDLSRLMDVTLGRITRVTQEMLNCGLINLERGAKDRRWIIVSLTEEGLRRRKELLDLDLKMCQMAMDRLDSERLDRIMTNLSEVKDAILAVHEDLKEQVQAVEPVCG